MPCRAPVAGDISGAPWIERELLVVSASLELGSILWASVQGGIAGSARSIEAGNWLWFAADGHQLRHIVHIGCLVSSTKGTYLQVYIVLVNYLGF
jgi:hypothetical protein